MPRHVKVSLAQGEVCTQIVCKCRSDSLSIRIVCGVESTDTWLWHVRCNCSSFISPDGIYTLLLVLTEIMQCTTGTDYVRGECKVEVTALEQHSPA